MGRRLTEQPVPLVHLPRSRTPACRDAVRRFPLQKAILRSFGNTYSNDPLAREASLTVRCTAELVGTYGPVTYEDNMLG